MDPPRPSVGLPKSIEGATKRYLVNYENNFNGPASDLFRLKSLAQAHIHCLRKVAPRFYEDKLPTLINQAASTLLTYDTSTQSGAKQFHEEHRQFLLVLMSLRESQPAGEVNYITERKRIEERLRLFRRQLELRKEIDELEAQEISCDDLGEEDGENANFILKLDERRSELKRISYEIAHIEGEQVEEEPDFELVVPTRSILNRLTQDQLRNLEKQMLDFYVANNKKKNAIYVDKSIIDGMIEKLNIDVSLFKKEELRDISKDALDAYKGYYRELDRKRRNESYENLIRDKNLRPKEGIIYESPDDIPDDAKRELENNDRTYKRQLEDIYEEYAKKPCPEESLADMLDDSDNDENEDTRIWNSIRNKAQQYVRVKEEPRDDYNVEETPIGSELVVDDRLASSLVDNDDDIVYAEGDQALSAKALANGIDRATGGDSQSDADNRADDVSEVEIDISEAEADADECMEQDDDDEDIECLGTVEPADKINTIKLDDE